MMEKGKGDNMDQNTFMETVKSVAEIIRTSAEPLSEEEILGYFADMPLDDDKKQLVLAYLMDSEHGTNKQSAVFKMYLEELSYLPAYSPEEEKQMYQDLLSGDDSAVKKISDAWLKKVLVAAEKYREPKLNVEDLVQEGNLALFLKLQELCGSNKDKTDVESVLKEAIEEGIMAYASEMNGERELENTILGKVSLVHEARKLLTEENGQVPTVGELSEYTKMPVEELTDLMDMVKAADEK